MKKKDVDDLNDSMLIADALFRIAALENILVNKGIITREEISSEMEIISHQIAKSILQKANVPGDLDEIINSLKKNVKKDSTEN